MLKLSVKDGQSFPTGWQEVVISNATDGTFDKSNGEKTRYIDLFFTGYPDSLKCRVWSAVNAETGEDFGIGNLFHHANAGITASEDGTVSIDDHVRHLKNKKLNVLFYENTNGFTDVVSRVAPVTQTTEHVDFNTDMVDKLKRSAERYHARRNNGAVHTNGTTHTTSGKEEAIPF